MNDYIIYDKAGDPVVVTRKSILECLARSMTSLYGVAFTDIPSLVYFYNSMGGKHPINRENIEHVQAHYLHSRHTDKA